MGHRPTRTRREQRQSGAMTDVDSRRVSPLRHGQAWTEQDFADVMEACRDGDSLEQIAERIGRSVNGLRNQLRRMLPADERHLAADVVLLRIRQLNRGGDYDWLAAMAEQPKSAWELQREAEQHSRATLLENARVVGIGSLPDGHILSLAAAVVDTRELLPSDLGQILAQEITERGLSVHLVARARDRLDGSLAAFLRAEPPARRDPERGEEWGEEWGEGRSAEWADEPPFASALNRPPWG